MKDYYSLCRYGKLDQIQDIPSEHLNDGLDAACLSGHINMVEFLLSKGANDLNRGLYNACIDGNIKIINLLLSKGANDFNRGLDGASYCYLTTKKDIILLMIIKGAAASLTSLREEVNISRCYTEDLQFDDIYYLLQHGIKDFKQFNHIANECKKFKTEFSNVINELFIKDVANVITSY